MPNQTLTLTVPTGAPAAHCALTRDVWRRLALVWTHMSTLTHTVYTITAPARHDVPAQARTVAQRHAIRLGQPVVLKIGAGAEETITPEG